MSIIINELKKITTTKPSSDENISRPRIHQSTLGAIQDKLTETYLKPKSERSTKDFESFLETYRRNERIKIAFAALLVVILTMITAFIFFSKDRFQINVSIERRGAGQTAKPILPVIRPDSYPRVDFTTMIVTGSLLTIGEPEKDAICLQRAEEGDESKAALVFPDDIDLSDAQIKFSLKGLSGGESAKIYFTDAFDNKLEARLSTLGSVWRKFSISIKNPGQGFHNEQIREIGFDFGAADLGNSRGMTVFLKDMNFVRDKHV